MMALRLALSINTLALIGLASHSPPRPSNRPRSLASVSSRAVCLLARTDEAFRQGLRELGYDRGPQPQSSNTEMPRKLERLRHLRPELSRSRWMSSCAKNQSPPWPTNKDRPPAHLFALLRSGCERVQRARAAKVQRHGLSSSPGSGRQCLELLKQPSGTTESLSSRLGVLGERTDQRC